MKQANKLQARQTKVIWHKCNSAAMQLAAVQAKGIAGLEYDVVATKDGVPVLFHDGVVVGKTVSDFFNGEKSSVEVSSLKYEDLKKIKPDVNSLEEVFKALTEAGFSEDFEFHLELKTADDALVNGVLVLLEKFKDIDKQTTIRSFDPEALIKVGTQRPEIPLCLLLEWKGQKRNSKHHEANPNTLVDALPGVEKIKEICGGIKPAMVSVRYQMLAAKAGNEKDKIITQGRISELQRAGINVEVYTLNRPEELRGVKVDGITTDVPHVMYDQINFGKQRAKL